MNAIVKSNVNGALPVGGIAGAPALATFLLVALASLII